MPLALFYVPYRLRLIVLIFRNLINADTCEVLPVSFGPDVIFSAFLLKNGDGASAALVDDCAHHFHIGYDRVSDDRTILFSIEQDIGPLDGRTLFSIESVDIEKIAGSDPILFSTCFNNGICHVVTPNRRS